MSSSSIVDSVARQRSNFDSVAGQRSNFNQTCSLLNQYLKKRKNLGDLDFGFKNFDSNDIASKTMNLLPMIEKSSAQIPEVQETVEPEPKKAQMTIFYAGQVMVFNDFTADKVEEIMLLASRGIPLSPPPVSASVASPPPPATAGINMVQENHTHKIVTNKISDVPIARKNSLTRFLEKRKDRITAKAPYQMSNKGPATTSKPAAENNPPWLGLGAVDNSI